MKIKNSIKIISFCLTTCLTIMSVSAQELYIQEDFDDISLLGDWEAVNQSSPIGDSSWFQGNGVYLPAHLGEQNAYIGANHRNVDFVTDGSGVICNYLIMPDLGSLESVSFYTRSSPASNNFNIYPDRMYVVYSPSGEINTGNCVDGFGDFTDTLLVINENQTVLNFPDGYPLLNWEQFQVEVNGSGRIAFVYFVEDAGFYGSNSNYIGLDTVTWNFAVTQNEADNSLFKSNFESNE